MQSTNKSTGRSGPRGNPEDMMWQGVRPKAPNLMNTAKLAEDYERYNKTNMDAPTRQNYAMPSIKGGASIHTTNTHEQQMPLSTLSVEEHNFPVNPMMAKHPSVQ